MFVASAALSCRVIFISNSYGHAYTSRFFYWRMTLCNEFVMCCRSHLSSCRILFFVINTLVRNHGNRKHLQTQTQVTEIDEKT